MSQMKYVDLHCDTLTECADKGGDLNACELQTSFEKLKNSNCAAQCFAVFTQGDGAALAFDKYLAFYKDMLKKHCAAVTAVQSGADILKCIETDKLGCILTVENLGFIGKDLDKLSNLKAAGVKMASLVWNYENDLAYPNLLFRGGMPQFQEREHRGLKPLGRQAVEILDGLGIIIDISHLSDGGAEEILKDRKTPAVASHSNAEAVCGVSRNLTDGLIKKIADCGGVIGINFCKDFLGEGDTYGLILRHIRHVINVGGEDVVALGSDFDGIPPANDLENCTKMPALFGYLHANGLPPRVLEKLAYRNALRVFAKS